MRNTGLKIVIEIALLLEKLVVDFRIFLLSVFSVKRLLMLEYPTRTSRVTEHS